MILVIGSGRDKVFPVLVDRLREAGARFRALDEDALDRPIDIAAEEDGANPKCGIAESFFAPSAVPAAADGAAFMSSSITAASGSSS